MKASEGAVYKPGMPEAPEAGERPGTFFFEVLARNQPCPHPDLRLWLPKQWDNESLLFEPPSPGCFSKATPGTETGTCIAGTRPDSVIHV